MSYKLILLSELKPTDLKMVLRPYVAIDIIRECHLNHTQIWDLDWHNDHADFMASPADKYTRVIDKLLLGHIVLLQWPKAQFDGVINDSGNVHQSMTMGIGNEVLVSKVRTLQASITKQESHSPASESKPLSKPIIAPVNTATAPARAIQNAAAAIPFEIEVELLDETDTPIANAEYILKLATDEERTGQLDGNGYKLFSGAEYKRSQIHFPQYEGYDWERAASAKTLPPPNVIAKQGNTLTPDPVEERISVPVIQNVTVLDVEPINFDVELKTHKKYPIADAEFTVELSDGSSREGRLDKEGSHHLEDIPEGELIITYTDYNDIFIKSQAAQLREAFDTRSNNTIFRVLSHSSNMIKLVVDVYDQWYNNLHGQGLVNDILTEFTIPSYKLAVIGLLVAGGIDAGSDETYYPIESTKNSLLALKPTPAISSIIKGHTFNLRIQQQKSTAELDNSSATYKWFVVHDEQAVAKDGASPITFLDDELEIEYTAAYYGQHIIMCCYQYHPGDGSVRPAEYYSYPINVGTVTSILAPDVETVETQLHQPELSLIVEQRYIDTLTQVASNTEMDEDASEQHEEELERLEDNAARLESLLASSEGKTRYPIKAVAVTLETSERIALKAFVYQKRVEDNWFSDDEHVWGLVDWTYCGNTQLCGEYEGTGNSAETAIKNAIADWASNSQIPESQIGYDVELINNNNALKIKGYFKTDGESNLGSVIKWVGYTALGAVGVALLFAPVPGSRVASAAIWTSIATSTTASVLSIYQRHDKGFSNLKDDGLDTLAIVGNIFGAGWMRQTSMQFSGAKQGLKAGKYLLFGQVGTDGASGVLLTVDAMIQIDEIKSSSALTPSEKIRQISELIRSLALVAAMTTLSLKGSKNDLANLNAGKPDIIVENPKLELSAKSRDKVHKGEVETKVVESDRAGNSLPEVTMTGKALKTDAPLPYKFDSIYEKAPAAKLEIDSVADELAEMFDGQVSKAPIKSRERAIQKIVNEYGGDSTRIKDLARNTIIVHPDKIDTVIAELVQRGSSVKVVSADTNPLGYSGINSTRKTQAGIIGETQVNTPAMIYAKEPESMARVLLGDDLYDSMKDKSGVVGGLGHKLYEQWRILPDHDASRAVLEAQSKAYYDSIRKSIYGN